VLLYIHVPFCRKKCAYCGFYSLPQEGERAGTKLIADYAAHLMRELRLTAEHTGRVPVETVFFGGGTPSLLPGKLIGDIVRMIHKLFILEDSAEISAEANPDSALDNGWLFEARRAGVNRLSLGVQSFDDDTLALLGRAHSSRAAQAAFETARTAGFSNISLDLMWALPGLSPHAQTQSGWLKQLKLAADLKPEHISTYGLALEPDCALEKAQAGGLIALPTEKEQASMYLAGADYLESQGYMQYEISNFARMGFECRHNIGYWEGKEYLGLGPAAVSTTGNTRRTNVADLQQWRQALAAGGSAHSLEELDDSTKAKEMLMLRLRMNKGLKLKDWQKAAGQSVMHACGPLIALLQKNGLASIRSGRLRLTRSGMLASSTIIAHFFAKMG
jgi:oxygen-independent coproporphyrinogen-3 oxidase